MSSCADRAKKICVLSKTDLVNPEQLSRQREAAEKLGEWDAMVGLSSRPGRTMDAFIEEVVFLGARGPGVVPARHGNRPADRGRGGGVHPRRRSCVRSMTKCPMLSACRWKRWNTTARKISIASSRASTWSATARRASSSANEAPPSSRSAPKRAPTLSSCWARGCSWTCRSR